MQLNKNYISSAAIVLSTIVAAGTSIVSFGDALGADSKYVMLFSVGAVAGVTVLMLRYLRPDFDDIEDSALPSRRVMRQLEEVEREVRFLRHSQSGAIVSDADRKRLIAQLREQVRTETAESILAAIEERVSNSFAADVPVEAVAQAYEKSTSRLSREVESLSRRGNVNLVIGLITALSGLFVLGFVVFSKPISDLTLSNALLYLLPRISLVLFVEVFAYFFLRLYRLSLDDIKYFQNELTGIESRCLGLQVALSYGEETVDRVVGILAQVDRNKQAISADLMLPKTKGGAKDGAKEAKQLVDSALALSAQARELVNQ